MNGYKVYDLACASELEIPESRRNKTNEQRRRTPVKYFDTAGSLSKAYRADRG